MLNLMQFFKTDLFIFQGHGYLWQSELTGLHIFSDGVIALAYYSISLTLLYLVCKRRDLPFTWVFLLFSALLVACGTSHLIEIWTLGYPAYWLSGIIKLTTAVLSLTTALLLVLTIPQALALSSPAQLQDANQILQGEIRDRKQIEAALQESEDRFQSLVANMPGMVYRFFPNKAGGAGFTYVSCGAYELLELEPDHILQDANRVWNLIDPDNRISLQTSIATAVQDCAHWHWEGQVTTPSGQRKWIQGSSRPQTTPDGLVWDGLFSDITDRQLAVIALQESEDRFREIANTIPQAFFVRSLNPDRFVYISPAYEKIWGRASAELLQNPGLWMEAIHPDDRDHVRATVAAKMQRTPITTVRLEYRIIRPDSAIRWVSAEIAIIRDAADQPLRFVGLAEDISDRKQAEMALQASESRYRILAEVSPVGIFRFDQPLNCVYVNDRWSEMTGRPKESALGKGWIAALHPDDRTEMLSQWANDYAQASPGELLLNRKEGRHLRPDGSINWYFVQVAQEIDSTGTVTGYVGTLTDITEHKVSELALSQEMYRRKTLFDTSLDGIVILDQTGRILEANASFAQMLGYDLEEITTLSLVDFDAHWTPSELEQKIEQASFCFNGFETRHRRKDGSIYHVDISSTPVNWDGQSVQFCICRDITDRKRAEEALRQSDRRFRAIFNTMFQFIGLLSPEGILLEANQATLEFAGLTPEEAINRPFWEGRWWTLSADTQARLQAAIAQAARGQFVRYEVDILGAGDRVATIDFSLKPIADEAGQVVLLIPEGRDITDRKQAEVERELQSIIVRIMAEGICLIKANDGTIVYANPKFEQMFGYDAGELKDKHISLINYGDEHTHPRAIHQEIATAVLQQGEAAYEVHNVKKDGTAFWGHAAISLFEHPGYGTVFVAVQQDITERKLAEAMIQTSLKEKEVLLKEIHHRVKNNLGVVYGLLQMQSRRSSDSQVVEALKESQNRITSIALVHEKLYGSDDLANIDFAQYIADLTAHLFTSYNIHTDQIQLTTQIDAIPLDIDTAIPCGLIINELVSNALKYAFSDAPGEIQVMFHQQPDQTLALVVRDNGVGLPQHFNLKQTKTLGMTLIQGLAQQLRGTLEISGTAGTTVVIRFASSRKS
ncbi:MAG TPA: PAS domain S-box protein [Coleofasciculaceae cyanobacterium]|jgi:PAS domain S-box-containing protein